MAADDNSGKKSSLHFFTLFNRRAHTKALDDPETTASPVRRTYTPRYAGRDMMQSVAVQDRGNDSAGSDALRQNLLNEIGLADIDRAEIMRNAALSRAKVGLHPNMGLARRRMHTSSSIPTLAKVIEEEAEKADETAHRDRCSQNIMPFSETSSTLRASRAPSVAHTDEAPPFQSVSQAIRRLSGQGGEAVPGATQGVLSMPSSDRIDTHSTYEGTTSLTLSVKAGCGTPGTSETRRASRYDGVAARHRRAGYFGHNGLPGMPRSNAKAKADGNASSAPTAEPPGVGPMATVGVAPGANRAEAPASPGSQSSPGRLSPVSAVRDSAQGARSDSESRAETALSIKSVNSGWRSPRPSMTVNTDSPGTAVGSVSVTSAVDESQLPITRRLADHTPPSPHPSTGSMSESLSRTTSLRGSESSRVLTPDSRHTSQSSFAQTDVTDVSSYKVDEVAEKLQFVTAEANDECRGRAVGVRGKHTRDGEDEKDGDEEGEDGETRRGKEKENWELAKAARMVWLRSRFDF